MKKKPTCKSCKSYKNAVCPGKLETCEDYKFQGNRHKGDKKLKLVIECEDPSCKYYDTEKAGKCKKGKGEQYVPDQCTFWDMRTSDKLGISEEETEKLIAKTKENRMPDNELRIESSEKTKERKKAEARRKAENIQFEDGKKSEHPQCECTPKDIPQGIKAADLIEVFHSGKMSNAFETLMDLCKEKGIEIIIRPVTK